VRDVSLGALGRGSGEFGVRWLGVRGMAKFGGGGE
jgi:hypothetical protein